MVVARIVEKTSRESEPRKGKGREKDDGNSQGGKPMKFAIDTWWDIRGRSVSLMREPGKKAYYDLNFHVYIVRRFVAKYSNLIGNTGEEYYRHCD